MSVAGDIVELLQVLIRNRCVNDGTSGSGQEVRNADTLQAYLGGTVPTQVYDAAPGRRSLIARLEGWDRKAPSLCLLAHTDVVPALDVDWKHDPFGGELVDDEVWGRGAVDMLNQTATMAQAIRELAMAGFRPRGDVIFAAVADEEARAEFGAKYLLSHHRDDAYADFVITEGGGWPLWDGRRMLSWAHAEKGIHWVRLTVRGRAGHAAQPHGSDHALVKAAQVIHRLAEASPTVQLTRHWEQWVREMGFDDDLRSALLDPALVLTAIETELPELLPLAHASTHLTVTPTVIHGGTVTNSIPESVLIDVDARTLPGQTRNDVVSLLDEALGPVAGDVAVDWLYELESTASPWQSALFDTAAAVTRQLVPDATLVPTVLTGSTDAGHYRRAGALAYGFGPLSGEVSLAEFRSRVHGPNERIDVASLALSGRFYAELVGRFQQ